MTYRLNLRARDDLRALYREGAIRFGVDQADRYFEELHNVLELLADFPKTGREPSGVWPPIRVHPFKSHVIVYEIDGADIAILRIRHGREDWLASPTAD